ncbi:MAG: peptide chain release factor N(5)-glutamine methyltransferase [Actinomycetota bacterium]
MAGGTGAEPVRPSEVVRRAADYLDRHGVDSPRTNAEILLMEVLGTDRASLYARGEGLSAAEAKAYGRALCQRCAGTPLQHLTGHQPFRGLDLLVRPGVFVPRPETEVLVEVALAMIASEPDPVVVDVGTGTGAVALAIAQERPDARVWATDLSPEAVALATENAHRAALHVTILEGVLLASVPEDLPMDLVVANPPYVQAADAESLPREVRADPELALYGGTEIHRRIAEEARGRLRPGGAVALEIGERQGAEVADILRSAGYERVEIHPDLALRDRVVSARRPTA